MRLTTLGTRIALLMGVMVTLTVAVAVGLSFLRLRGEMERALSQELTGLAISVAQQVPGDSLALLRAPQDTASETYESLRSFLRQMRLRGGLKDDFVIARAVRGKAEAIVSSSGIRLLPGDVLPLRDEFLAAVRETRPQVTSITSEGKGFYLRAYAPIRDGRGTAIAALEIKREVEPSETTLARVLLAWIGPWLLLLLVGILAGMLLSEGTNAEARSLAGGAEMVASGQLDAA